MWEEVCPSTPEEGVLVVWAPIGDQFKEGGKREKDRRQSEEFTTELRYISEIDYSLIHILASTLAPQTPKPKAKLEPVHVLAIASSPGYFAQTTSALDKERAGQACPQRDQGGAWCFWSNVPVHEEPSAHSALPSVQTWPVVRKNGQKLAAELPWLWTHSEQPGWQGWERDRCGALCRPWEHMLLMCVCPPPPRLTTATSGQTGREEDGYSYSPSLHGSFRRDLWAAGVRRAEDGNGPSLQLQVPWSHLPESGSVWGSSCGHLCSPVLPEAHTVGPRGQGSSVPTTFTQCDIWAESPWDVNSILLGSWAEQMRGQF
jgi:hypothetical protein